MSHGDQRKPSPFDTACHTTLRGNEHENTTSLLSPPALPQTETTKAKSDEAAKQEALARTRTAALVVVATTTVSCGDGSEGGCIHTDRDVISKVEDIVRTTELWRQLDKVDATKADVILGFKVKNATTDHGTIELTVRDADTSAILWSEYRPVVDLDNDVSRLVAHFLKAKSISGSSRGR